jgi:hypothetical protein
MIAFASSRSVFRTSSRSWRRNLPAPLQEPREPGVALQDASLGGLLVRGLLGCATVLDDLPDRSAYPNPPSSTAGR